MTNDGGKASRDSLDILWVLDEISSLNLFVDVCLAGLRNAADATDIIRVARKVDKALHRPDRFGTSEAFEEALKEATCVETFSKSECGTGFPYLYNLAAVRLWTIMESAIDELILDIVRLRREVRQTPSLQKLKGPLVSFMSSSPEDQAEFLVNALKEEVRASLQTGIGRFEAILSALGFGGPVHDEARRVFLELSELRHVLIHRRGRADAKLVRDRCPWLPLKVGDVVTVRGPEFHSFRLACYWYVLELNRRLTVYEGDMVNKEDAELQSLFERKLVEIRAHLWASKDEATGGES
jgi:hypothetical protein